MGNYFDLTASHTQRQLDFDNHQQSSTQQDVSTASSQAKHNEDTSTKGKDKSQRMLDSIDAVAKRVKRKIFLGMKLGKKKKDLSSEEREMRRRMKKLEKLVADATRDGSFASAVENISMASGRFDEGSDEVINLPEGLSQEMMDMVENYLVPDDSSEDDEK